MIFPQLLTSLKLICFLILSVPVAIFLLATITWILQQQRSLGRAKRRRNDTKNHQEQSSTLLTSAIYCGRVSHTRFLPVKHGFSYPLFFCLLDLQEVPKLFHGKWPLIWPLTYVMNFREHDHLKNGEGMSASSSSSSSSSLQPQDGHDECPLIPRIRQLVQERTGGKFVPGHDQQILLLTHLSYFGYCFNPVSFYYILKRGQDLNASSSPSSSYDNNNIEAIVAEVSNTPWNEMKCYVLHPDSQDMMQVKDGMCRKQKSIHNENQKSWNSINYIFAKKFHVSPFMDMEHIYDWTFWHLTKHDIVVSTTMKKEKKTLKTLGTVTDSSGQEHNVNETVTYFNAFFDISRKSFHPFFICYQLIRFPMYCMIVQIWIHIQAFKLFVKGVEFIPHPEGSETAASRIIGQLMAPLFAVKDWWYSRRRHGYTPTTTTHTTGATPSSTTTTTARSGYEERRGHAKVD